jgi:hypothetical protein
MKLSRYFKFINEDASTELKDNLSDDNKELKSDLLDLIEKSAKSKNKSVTEELDTILKNPKETSIEGLIQDSDVQDFYRKYRNDIDLILSENDFFEKISDFQKKNNCISLYDLVVVGTMECVRILVSKIKEELPSEPKAE